MKKIWTIAGIAALFLTASCNKQSTEPGVVDEGAVAFKVTVAEPSLTKGGSIGAAAEELLQSTVINIYKADFSGLVRSYTYADAPEKIYLPADAYRCDVLAGGITATGVEAASWTVKSYKGSTPFSVVAAQDQSVSVEATICNAVSQVSFDASVEANFQAGYSMTVSLDEALQSDALVYTKEHSGDLGYFILGGFEPSIYWCFDGLTASDGTPVHKSGVIRDAKPGVLYKMSPKFSVRDGQVEMLVLVDYETSISDDVIVFEPTSSGLTASKPSEIWAGHATVHADVNESEYPDPTKVKFEYGAGGSEWLSADATREGEGVYSAVLKGLSGATEYQYRLVIAGEVIGDPMSFTTERALQFPNWDLETTSNAESSKWTSFFDPNSSELSLQTKFWDSGSSASAGMLGESYAICYSDTDVPAGIGSTKSARLESKSAAGKLAAGNLFVGEFAGLSGLNGKVNFGRPWKGGRPTGVRLWYKYNGGVVDKTASGADIKSGEYDICSVRFAIGTWDYRKYGGTKECPIQVNTSDTKTFWPFATLPETIAYTELEVRGSNQTPQWKQVTLTFDYKDTEAMPTYILVSGAASKYGDYFAGSSSSKLYLDNIELLYE